MRLVWIAALAAGCSAAGKSDGEDGTNGVGGTDGCGFDFPDDIGDELAGIPADAGQCEGQPYYDPEVPWVTVWYTGEFDIDKCGVVTGIETWQVFPNPLLQDAGMDVCEIVYDVTGSQGEAGGSGDFRLTLTAVVSEEKTTCVVFDNQPLYSGFDKMDLVYDVEVDDASGGSAFYYESGNLLGAGYGNPSHVNYLSSFVCQTYVVDY